VPKIGYDKAAAIAQRAYAGGKTIRQILTEDKILTAEEIDALLKIG